MKRILIIEDQPEVRDLVRLTLEVRNFHVSEAENGVLGLERAQAEPADLILLDLQLPGSIDGLEVCRRLKADPTQAGAAIIILTASHEPAWREAALALGAHDFLVKPFSPRQLLQAVQQFG